MRHPAFSRFLTVLALLFTAGFAGGLGLNLLVDPFRLLDSPAIDGVNTQRTELNNRERLFKPYEVTRRQPASLVVGSSRAEIGVDTAHPFLAKPAYNLGVMGANSHEMRRLFEHALAVAPVRQAVIMLDLSSFNAYRPVQPGFEDRRLARLGEPPPRPWLADAPVLVSADALEASWKTLGNQWRGKTSAHQPDGRMAFEPKGNPETRRLFLDNERGYLAETWFPSPRRQFCLGGTLDDLKAMLDMAAARGVAVTLVISPVHARQLETIQAGGLWPSFEAWKAAIVALSPGPVWDFALAGPLNREPVPPPGDRSPMRWWQESSHMRVELGALMLDRLAGAEGDFGAAVTPASLAGHLAQARALQAEWRADHPEDVAEIAALNAAAPANRTTCPPNVTTLDATP